MRVLTCKWSASCAVVSGLSTPLKIGETSVSGSDDSCDLEARRACAECLTISILHCSQRPVISWSPFFGYTVATRVYEQGLLNLVSLLGSQLFTGTATNLPSPYGRSKIIKRCTALQSLFSINFKMIARRFLCHGSHRIVAATRWIFLLNWAIKTR